MVFTGFTGVLFLVTASIVAHTASADRTTLTGGKKEICISDWSPMVTCTPDGDHTKFSGYQVELFRQAADSLGWSKTDYYFRCMDWTPMTDDLVSANGTCYMSAAGMDITLDLIKEGVQFTWPTYKQGLQILVSATVESSNVWSLFAVFHWTVWFALFATGVLVGGILWVTETYGTHLTLFDDTTKKGEKMVPALIDPTGTTVHDADLFQKIRRRKSALRQMQIQMSGLRVAGLGHATYYTIARLMDMGEPEPITLGGRVVALAYGFLVLIMVNLYTANMAASVTTTRIRSMITSKEDLPGKAVGTWTPYLDQLRKYSILATGLSWENQEDEVKMISLLKSGRVKALVLDKSFVNYKASYDCNLHSIGDPFDTWNLGFAFPPGTNSSIVEGLNDKLLDLQKDSAFMDVLADRFINVVSQCNKHINTEDVQLTFKQVAGLWIILAVSIAICFSMLAVSWYHKYQRKGTQVADIEAAHKAAGQAPPDESALGQAALLNHTGVDLASSEHPSRAASNASEYAHFLAPGKYGSASTAYGYHGPSRLQAAGSLTTSEQAQLIQQQLQAQRPGQLHTAQGSRRSSLVLDHAHSGVLPGSVESGLAPLHEALNMSMNGGQPRMLVTDQGLAISRPGSVSLDSHFHSGLGVMAGLSPLQVESRHPSAMNIPYMSELPMMPQQSGHWQQQAVLPLLSPAAPLYSPAAMKQGQQHLAPYPASHVVFIAPQMSLDAGPPVSMHAASFVNGSSSIADGAGKEALATASSTAIVGSPAKSSPGHASSIDGMEHGKVVLPPLVDNLHHDGLPAAEQVVSTTTTAATASPAGASPAAEAPSRPQGGAAVPAADAEGMQRDDSARNPSNSGSSSSSKKTLTNGQAARTPPSDEGATA